MDILSISMATGILEARVWGMKKWDNTNRILIFSTSAVLEVLISLTDES